MTELCKETCTACEIGAPLVSTDQQTELLKDLDGWIIDNSDISKLTKVFKLKNYEQSIAFTNLIADLAESQDHHPKLLSNGDVLAWSGGRIKLRVCI